MEIHWEEHKDERRSLLLTRAWAWGLLGMRLFGIAPSLKQYEPYFKTWGFRKNRMCDDWKIVGCKIEKRKPQGKASVVSLEGALVPEKKLKKEICRHALTTLESRALKLQKDLLSLHLKINKETVGPEVDH
ncbi:hypothetical protein BJX64DRAFT_284906 [Aspergillus heterothallicus]